MICLYLPTLCTTLNTAASVGSISVLWYWVFLREMDSHHSIQTPSLWPSLPLCLLSPIPSFTSDPTPRPPIFLISYSNPFLTSYFLQSHYLSYPLISFVPFPFTPCLFVFCLTLHVSHATDNHVVLFSSCSHIMCWLNLMSLRSLLCFFSNICFHSSPLFPTFMYLNSVSPSIQVNLIIAYSSLYFLLLFIFSYSLNLYLQLQLLSDFNLTSVWLLYNCCPTSDLCPKIIGHTRCRILLEKNPTKRNIWAQQFSC